MRQALSDGFLVQSSYFRAKRAKPFGVVDDRHIVVVPDRYRRAEAAA